MLVETKLKTEMLIRNYCFEKMQPLLYFLLCPVLADFFLSVSKHRGDVKIMFDILKA